MIFSKYLKREMQKAGLTNQALAEKTNISEASISKFVNSKRKPSKTFVNTMNKVFTPEALYTLNCARCADMVVEYGFNHIDLDTVGQMIHENN